MYLNYILLKADGPAFGHSQDAIFKENSFDKQQGLGWIKAKCGYNLYNYASLTYLNIGVRLLILMGF